MRSLLLKMVGLGAKPAKKRRGALIIPSAAPGSIGDDAMVMSLVTALEDAGEGPVRVLARGGGSNWPSVAPGSLLELPKGKMRALALARAMRQTKRVLVIGADCLDGHYSVALSRSLIGSADLGAHAGALATIVGSSFKASPIAGAVDALRTLHPSARVCGRDPRTVERVTQLTGRGCELVADVAFMLKPTDPKTPGAPADLAWITERRNAGRVLLGVNFNRQVLGKNPSREEFAPLFDAYEGALTRLLSERDDLDILCIPHDYRGDESDCAHAGELAARIGRPDRARALTEKYRASEIKTFASRMDLILTGRMHLAIEAMGAGVPVCCVTYQDKFEGLFDLFKMEPIVLAPENATAETLHAMVAGALDRRADLRERVGFELGRVREMSRANLGLGAPAGGAG